MITTLIPPITAACFAVCTIVYAATAKRNAPITLKDARIIWQLHKKNARCTSHKWQPLTQKHGEITGFQCQCGYKYSQKRPLISRMPKTCTSAIGKSAAKPSMGTVRKLGCRT